MLKRFMPILLVLCVVLGFAACGNQKPAATSPSASSSAPKASESNKPEEKKTYVIGYSQAATSTEWEIAQTSATQEPMEKAGYKVLYSDGQSQQETQVAALRSFIAQGVDAIVIRPVTTTGWDVVVNEIKEAGIPLIVIGRRIELTDGDINDYALCYIGPDNVYAGELLANAALDYFKDKDGPVNAVVLEGTVGASAAIERTEGINNVASKNDKLKILYSQTANFTRQDGKIVMEAIIKSAKANNQEIHAVLGENDDMSIGAVQALIEAGLKPGSDIFVGGVDGVYSAFEAMVEGTYNATIENPLQYGVEVVKVLDAYFKDGTEPEDWIVLENQLYTSDTAAEDIKHRLY